ncbi:ABC transporter permease [Dehalococcoides mccartyi]|jgi:ABC-2 type transport system permease protein|uniref:Putative ABC transporter, permease protein n=1 Tax=Dehalococcoides mccartyi TaxID=61435 RepID=A0A328EPC0_9CHLR|nr:MULTISPECIES: ABC transporter permease subunit [Dehalococcoides]AGG06798.1 ABC transporter permease [Dehalococcoides mccartyi DCMB5]AQX75010.1 ABC transporter permease [Dehalococcoides mccartyi]AQY73585.1 ABC transporter permease [Dehalococcoides mccartyi]PKH45531.1 ABC transporter permease [Dehalococcoides mccartyi]RAL69201.1 putative ABC transporter, permease protein [Dehalococcoides mccartyi]
MKNILTVAKKEMRDNFSNKGMLIQALIMPLLFGFLYSNNLSSQTGLGLSLNGVVFYLSIMISAFMSYMFLSQAFVMEKYTRTIESLMCTPLSLRDILLGKVLGVSASTYPFVLLAVLIPIVRTGLENGEFILPSLAIFIQVLFVTPLVILGFVNLMGFLNLYVGLKEYRILNLIVFVPMFGLMGAGIGLASNIDAQWTLVGIVAGVALLLLGISTYLTRFLNRERIVTTLP